MRSLVFVVLLMLAPTLPAQTVVLAEKPALLTLLPENASLEKIATGFRFLEGPTWNPQTHLLTFSDIPGDRLYRFDPAAPAAPAIFREPSNHANGNTTDTAGNLLTCEHGTRRVTRTHPDGTLDTLAERFDGKLLNSPNDLVEKSDGTIWFTDPTYGLEGRPREQTANRVYRLDPKTGSLTPVATDFDQPNGLCFSPDEKLLYIADSGKPRHVRVFDVTADNRLANGRVFCQIDKGVPDGMRCDRHGNLFSSAEDGIQIFAPDSTRLGKILVPETPANLCFGGKDGDELFITARTSLYRIKLTTTGAGTPGKAGH